MTGLATIAALAVATVVGGCGSPGETRIDTGTQPALTTSDSTTAATTTEDAIAAAAREFQRLSDELQGSDDDSPEVWTDENPPTLDELHQVCIEGEVELRRFTQGLQDYPWPTNVQAAVDQVIADFHRALPALHRCQEASTLVEAANAINELTWFPTTLINMNEVRGLLGLEWEYN
jgi:hypothetical protein